MNRMERIIFLGAMFIAGELTVADARADVRSRVKIRMQQQAMQPARDGEPCSGVLELIAPKNGVLERVEIVGEGWRSLSVGLRAATPVAQGETILVPFQADELDASKKLEVRVTFDGAITHKRFDLSPERFARLGRDRPIVRMEMSESAPAPNVEGGSDGAGSRGCDDQQIRLHGRFEYERPGRDFSVPPDGDFNEPGDVMPVDNSMPPDGDFTDPSDVAGVDNSIPPDGDFNDGPDVAPAIIGADGIWFQIMDDDSPDPIDEVMYSGYTDVNGYFDVTICWDDCDVTGCDDPDIYVRFECDTDAVNVQDGFDPLEEDYSWSTDDDPWDDFTGNDIDFGIMRPSDPSQYQAVHIHNSITRVHRFVLEYNGDFVPEVDAQWPEDSTEYNPFFEDMYIAPDEEWNEGSQTHEWGHHLFNHWLDLPDTSYCNGFCDATSPNPCNSSEPCDDDGGHCLWCRENDVDAWNEGFANWLGSVQLRNWQARYGIAPWTQFSRASNNDNRYTLEFVRPCCNNPPATLHDPWITEGFVGALLRDIEDPPQDPGQTTCPQDALGLGAEEILAVTRDSQPQRVVDFIQNFRTRYPQHDQDFRSTCQAVAPVYINPWNGTVPAIQIIAMPACDTYRAGETITLNVQTNGSRYSTCMQWQRNGVALSDDGRIAGSRTDSLTIANVTPADAGTYALVITTCDGVAPQPPCSGTQTLTSPTIPVYIFGGNGPAHRVTGWGRNLDGALGRGTTTPGSDVNPADVLNLNNVVAVSAGYWNSFALLSDGTVWGWGSRYLGNGTSTPSATPVQVNGLSDIVAVSAGGQWTTAMALDANGHIWTWGDNFFGQLGYPGGVALNPGQLNLDCAIDISMGPASAAAVTSDGSLWVWGNNGAGQFGQGTFGGTFSVPVRVADLSNIVEVECGSEHILARRADGTLWACGRNSAGQLGDGTLVDRNRFVQVIGLTSVTQIATGLWHSLAVLADSTPWAWGLNSWGSLGTGSSNSWNPTPARVQNVTAVRALDGGYWYSAFVASDGTIWTCGYNGNGELGRPTLGASDGVPRPVDTRVGGALQISTGASFMMVISPGARITGPVPDQLAAGCATAQFTVATAGEPPMSYQWGRNVGGLFVPLSDGGRISGATTPTLSIAQTESLDTDLYQVRVFNATNDVLSIPHYLVTPPSFITFDTEEHATRWWNNERGNWAVTDGAYAAGAPDDHPATYSSFRLPHAASAPRTEFVPLTDFLIELDVVNATFTNFNLNGGIWVRSRLTSNEPDAALLGFGDRFPWSSGDLWWQRWHEAGGQSPQDTAADVYDAGDTIHLRVEVRGNTYTAYLNDSPTPTTEITTAEYPTGRVALFDNAPAGTAFDNVFIQTLTNCDPGSGMEPVRVIQRPQSQAVASGSQVALSVVATGTGPLSYQWVRNGYCVPDAIAATYSFTASAPLAQYECTVSNACGSVGSFPAVVTTTGGPPGDVDGDGHVGLQDLALVLSSFGACAGQPGFNPAADIDADGCVGLQDLAILLGSFGA